MPTRAGSWFMKTFSIFAALLGLLVLTGCSTYQGGTADDYDRLEPGRGVSDMESGWSSRPDRTTGPVIPPP